MKRFKNILVVVKDDELNTDNPALVRGINLAQGSGARLTLMGVIRPPGRALTEYKGIFKPKELETMLAQRLEQSLSTLAEHFGDTVDIRVKVATGKDFIEIIRQVVYNDHDLLLKMANRHKASFDSSDFHLMRKCPVPVWLHKSDHQDRCHKVLAAVDLDLESDEDGQTLNASIMEFATSISQWEQSVLHLLSCWSLYGESALRDSAFMSISEDELTELLTREEQQNQIRMNALTARYPHVEIHSHLIEGRPEELIPAFALEHGIDTVVMGTVARSGIPGLLIGNTAETILQKIDSSVVTLKPSGFESIIK